MCTLKYSFCFRIILFYIFNLVVLCIFLWKLLQFFTFYLWYSEISWTCVSCVAIFIHPAQYSIDSSNVRICLSSIWGNILLLPLKNSSISIFCSLFLRFFLASWWISAILILILCKYYLYPQICYLFAISFKP